MSKAKKKTQQRRSPAEISSSNKRLADEIRRRALLQTGALPELPVEVQLEMPVQAAFEAPPEPIPAPAPPESFMPVRRGRPPVGEESRTVPARMAAVMGDRTMTAGEVEAALEAVGERLQSGNVRSYISTTLNSSTTSVLDSSGQPLLYRSGGRLKVHFFTCTERGHYRVSTPQDILAETQKLQALDVEKLGTPVLEAGSPAQRQILIDALTRADGNRTKAAQELGIDRNTLRLRLNKCGIDAQAYVKHSGVKGLPVTSFSGAHRGNVPPTVPEIDAIFRNRNGGRPAHLGNLAAARLARRVFPQPVLDVLNERIGQVLVEVLTPYLKVMAAFDDRN